MIIILRRVIPSTTFQNSHVKFYVSLIGSSENRHTTHLLKCVLYFSTSQTDWKQCSDILSDILSDISSGILSDISVDIVSDIPSGILFDISFDISVDILSEIPSGILSDISFDLSSDILSDTFFGILSIFWHSFWHIFGHSFGHIFWDLITWRTDQLTLSLTDYVTNWLSH